MQQQVVFNPRLRPRCSGFGGELPEPHGDGPNLPIGRLDPGRPPPGHRALPHRRNPHQQEEEVGADVVLQRAKEGEALPVNHMKRLISEGAGLKTAP